MTVPMVADGNCISITNNRSNGTSTNQLFHGDINGRKKTFKLKLADVKQVCEVIFFFPLITVCCWQVVALVQQL